MKQFLFTFFIVFLSGLLLIGFFNTVLFVQEDSSSTPVVISVIAPVRLIVVDNDLTIQKIYSNTTEDVRPLVVFSSVDGKEAPYSDAIIAQYQYLKPSLNFSKPGIVYEREEKLIPALVKSFGRMVTHWFPLQ